MAVVGGQSRVFDLLYNKFFRTHGNTILILLVLILLIIVANYGYHKFYLDKPHQNLANDNINAVNGIVIKIYMFSADWCPHCTKASPSWNKFKTEYDGKIVNGYKISCQKVDCSNRENPAPLQTKYGIKQYPTILAVKPNGKDDEEIKYDSKITTENLETFMREICK